MALKIELPEKSYAGWVQDLRFLTRCKLCNLKITPLNDFLIRTIDIRNRQVPRCFPSLGTIITYSNVNRQE